MSVQESFPTTGAEGVGPVLFWQLQDARADWQAWGPFLPIQRRARAFSKTYFI
jgi:hypothetical protein